MRLLRPFESSPGVVAQPSFCRIDTRAEVADGIVVEASAMQDPSNSTSLSTGEPDVFAVHMKFLPKVAADLVSVEDRYDFAPGRRAAECAEWPGGFCLEPEHQERERRRYPQCRLQVSGSHAAAGKSLHRAHAHTGDRVVVPLALDLDVTSDRLPWLSFGAMSSQPYGHSYFRRDLNGGPKIIPTAGETGVPQAFVEYAYSIVASSQPPKLGYRRVVRLLWKDEGRKELESSLPICSRMSLRRQLTHLCRLGERYVDSLRE